MPTTTCEVVVVGCGGVGSSALFHLAARGVRVLGVEQFSAPHDRGKFARSNTGYSYGLFRTPPLRAHFASGL